MGGIVLKINENDLVMQSVFGQISNPVIGKNPYRISARGRPMVLPGVGGITYNVKVGDKAVGWVADHVEPGVSVKCKDKEMGSAEITNFGLNVLACIGNKALVISGDAKGEFGQVTGKHGGIEHVLIDFDDDILDKLAIGDKVQIKAWGLGLRFIDHPEVEIRNISPDGLKSIPIETGDGKLKVPVTHVVPASIMGSGLGHQHVHSGDYDIQMFDNEIVRSLGLEDIRLGDLVTIENADHTFGRIYQTGAVSVGVVVHTDCVTSGHGPGVTTIFTSSSGHIVPRITESANIGRYLGIGRYRKSGKK
jgi:hypothetical protein